MRRTILIIFGIIIIGISWHALNQPRSVQHPISSVKISSSGSTTTTSARELISITDLQSDYKATPTQTQEKARILIIPGHEPNFGGTRFGNLYERNLVVELGQDLQQFLQTNNNYQVFVTRDKQAWNPTFADYFKNSWNDIVAWVKTSRQNALSYLASIGAKTPTPKVLHNTDPTNVALRLYGITKWANESNIDLMIHIHLNNYPGHPSRIPGKYSGLVIYAPAQQYSNSTTTRAIAEAVFKRLAMYNPIDDLRAESSGVIDDPELIAVGANNTSDAASMLIEYDYVYQPQFVNSQVRSLALKDLAYQTYLGLQDFFTKNSNVSPTNLYNPTLLYTWNKPVTGKNSNPSDIYALQTALLLDGDYPPAGKNKNECPHSGTFGSCTLAALRAFQKKHGITDENGIVGKKTLNLLISIYSRTAL